jgi:hypothetical protein
MSPALLEDGFHFTYFFRERLLDVPVVVVEVIDDDVISELEHSKVLNILVER